jgi:hypothetical protein
MQMAIRLYSSCPHCGIPNETVRIGLVPREGKPYGACSNCGKLVNISKYQNEWVIASVAQKRRWFASIVFETFILLTLLVFVALIWIFGALGVPDSKAEAAAWVAFFLSVALTMPVNIYRMHRIKQRSVERLRGDPEYVKQLIAYGLIKDQRHLSEILRE